MNKKNSSIIFTIALVAGIIGLSPISVYAQTINSNAATNEDNDLTVGENSGFACNNVNIIQSTNILDVDNTNTNTAAAAAAANTNEPIQPQNQQDNFDALINGKQLSPDKILNSLFGSNTNGNGEPPLNFDDRFGCVSVNTNDVDSGLVEIEQEAESGG